jgi:hypothetical protein
MALAAAGVVVVVASQGNAASSGNRRRARPTCADRRREKRTFTIPSSRLGVSSNDVFVTARHERVTPFGESLKRRAT